MPKRDRLGIHAKVESVLLEMLALAIAAAFTSREKKKPILESTRLKTEIAKQLIRTEHELHIISETSYLPTRSNCKKSQKC